jgi:ribosomal protein L39E
VEKEKEALKSYRNREISLWIIIREREREVLHEWEAEQGGKYGTV